MATSTAVLDIICDHCEKPLVAHPQPSEFGGFYDAHYHEGGELHCEPDNVDNDNEAMPRVGLKIYRAINIDGRYLSGKAIVVERSKAAAMELLLKMLLDCALPQSNPERIKLEPINISAPLCIITDDGDY